MLAAAVCVTACSPSADVESDTVAEAADPGDADGQADQAIKPGDPDAAPAADHSGPVEPGDPAGPAGPVEPAASENPEAPAAETTAVSAGSHALEALAGSLTSRQKALQLLVVSSWGPRPAATIAEELGTDCVGGVFVAKGLEHWVPPTDAAAAAEAIAEIADASSDCAAPPFIASDAEPGTAILKVPVEPLPAPASLAGAYRSDPDASRAISDDAAAFAADLRALGVHVNFGVVADVDAGPDYFMASKKRTFGSDPAVVAAVSEALVEGHCRSGVAAALKHFPNQGSTVEDPHLRDSYSTNDPRAWAVLGRIPYASVTAPLVMTGHVRYREVDQATPASLSAEITTGWLRDGLGYRGLIISDDLYSMHGAGAEMEIPDRGVAAILAGNDMALYLSAGDVAGAVDELARLIEAKGEAAHRLEASLRRVLGLKAALGLLDGFEQAWFPLCGPVASDAASNSQP